MKPELPLLSIIIPCYKTEKTLEETLRSIINQEYNHWEAIIVNDGSPDNVADIALAWVEKDSRFKYYKKENGGLGSARNFGINKSIGIYILPLDSDNLISPDFFINALPYFEKDACVGMVYGNAEYFGERNGVWIVGAFDKFKVLHINYIDACAIIRKAVFDEIGLYEESLPHQGHEDWEFWIRLTKSSFNFHYIPKITFKYRVQHTSMIRTFSSQMEHENINFIKQKHLDVYLNTFNELYVAYNTLKIESEKTILERIKRKLKKYFNRIK